MPQHLRNQRRPLVSPNRRNPAVNRKTRRLPMVTKATKKAVKKTKKKSEPGTAPITEAEVETPLHDPDEPELKAASQAATDEHGESQRPAALPVAPEAEAELLAEAADTFEQAYEERLTPEHPGRAVADVEAAELKNAEAEPYREEL